jgi:hypothetical protein
MIDKFLYFFFRFYYTRFFIYSRIHNYNYDAPSTNDGQMTGGTMAMVTQALVRFFIFLFLSYFIILNYFFCFFF